ncbi:hypothetical protein KDA_13060 [Dictyobacter alpinus]|uniref:Uncharacterized protein n=1 Tax=Dictyobacter alpinus TaxID=2014873 RepID=A0A402B395_9CHLR|nr:hypothetical protein KDA_13060 [Dictyobacter alpinus]
MVVSAVAMVASAEVTVVVVVVILVVALVEISNATSVVLYPGLHNNVRDGHKEKEKGAGFVGNLLPSLFAN